MRTDGEWTRQAVLTAGDVTTNGFGYGLALQGDTALIGAPGATPDGGDGMGLVYEFTRVDGVWSQTATLVSSDRVPFDGFGGSVALQGERAVIGAPSAPPDAGYFRHGTAYVFTRAGLSWTQVELPDVSGVSDFGNSVAIDGDTVLVGASATGELQGSAHVFELDGDTWRYVADLDRVDECFGDRFGWSVALQDGVALIGAPERNAFCGDYTYQGAAYVFIFADGTWRHQARLLPADSGDFDYVGSYVALDGGLALVGAFNKSGPVVCARGAAYLYAPDGDSWVQVEEIIPEDDGGLFGDRVAFSGSVALITATLAEFEGTLHVGKVYPYQIGPDCNQNDRFDTLDLALGESTDCDANGAPDECDPDCNANGVADACDLAAGTSPDCDANGVPDECDPDCNANGAVDACDLAGGTSPDCNANGVPDECDFASGLSTDCNGNGLPDECDANFAASSGILSFIGAQSPREHRFAVSDRPICDVIVELQIRGDFDSSSEYVTVQMDGVSIGTLFEVGPPHCGVVPGVGRLSVAVDTFNAAAADGEVVIAVLPSAAVDKNACGTRDPSYVQIFLRYLIAPQCPVSGCATSDIFPAGGGDCVLDLNDVGTLLAHWTGPGNGCGATRDDGDIYPAFGDGCVDLQDLGQMLSDFGADCRSCCPTPRAKREARAPVGSAPQEKRHPERR